MTNQHENDNVENIEIVGLKRGGGDSIMPNKVFDSFKEAEKYIETEYYDEYIAGKAIYVFYTGNKRDGYKYMVTLDFDDHPKGWRLYEL